MVSSALVCLVILSIRAVVGFVRLLYFIMKTLYLLCFITCLLLAHPPIITFHYPGEFLIFRLFKYVNISESH